VRRGIGATPSSRRAFAGFVLDAFAGAPAGASAGDRRPPPAATPSSTSSPRREREVCRHIARGYMYKEIALSARHLAKTVEAHVSAVLRKLQLSSRHELSRWGRERRCWTADRAGVPEPDMTTADRGPAVCGRRGRCLGRRRSSSCRRRSQVTATPVDLVRVFLPRPQRFNACLTRRRDQASRWRFGFDAARYCA